MFLEYMVQQMEAHKASVNYTVLLDAFPSPRNEKELKLLQKVLGFIVSTEIKSYIKKFDNMRYQTREVLMQNVLEYLQISDDVMSKPKVYGCIMYYVVKAYLNVCSL